MEGLADMDADLVDRLRDWPLPGPHNPDQRGFCQICSTRMPCEWLDALTELHEAADEIERLRLGARKCMYGTATFWRHHIKAEERMCSGTLTWILRAGAGVVSEGDVVFISKSGTEWIWDGDDERLKIIDYHVVAQRPDRRRDG